MIYTDKREIHNLHESLLVNYDTYLAVEKFKLRTVFLNFPNLFELIVFTMHKPSANYKKRFEENPRISIIENAAIFRNFLFQK